MNMLRFFTAANVIFLYFCNQNIYVSNRQKNKINMPKYKVFIAAYNQSFQKNDSLFLTSSVTMS